MSDARHDMDRGLFFAHVMATENRREAQDRAVFLAALVDELVAAGLLDREAFEAQVETTRRAQYEEQVEGYALCRIDTVDDKYTLTDLPVIDCASRVERCKARCCTFTHVLSAQDLDEGELAWEPDRPYVIRAGDDGYCVHHDRERGTCTVHGRRPASCRIYDCRADERIWLDFDAGVPAPDPPEPPAD